MEMIKEENTVAKNEEMNIEDNFKVWVEENRHLFYKQMYGEYIETYFHFCHAASNFGIQEYSKQTGIPIEDIQNSIDGFAVTPKDLIG